MDLHKFGYVYTVNADRRHRIKATVWNSNGLEARLHMSESQKQR